MAVDSESKPSAKPLVGTQQTQTTVVALFDSNTVGCYYSSFETEQKALLMALPPVVGAISSTVFVVFPNTRHGIGYPATQATAKEQSFVAV
ncbi:hypothetical protein AAC387_Pa03g2252 [Persea americana]